MPLLTAAVTQSVTLYRPCEMEDGLSCLTEASANTQTGALGLAAGLKDRKPDLGTRLVHVRALRIFLPFVVLVRAHAASSPSHPKG